MNQSFIKDFIRDVYASKLVLSVPIEDSVQVVDLRYKDLEHRHSTSCTDCGTEEIKYTVYTDKDSIQLSYQLDFMGMQPISLTPNPRPLVELVDWLYMHKLTKATIPENDMAKGYFDKRRLRTILNWAKR